MKPGWNTDKAGSPAVFHLCLEDFSSVSSVPLWLNRS